MVETHQLVRENLSNINRQISNLARSRQQHQLSVPEQEYLAQLRCEKDHELVQALQLRQSGDEMIKLAVLGKPEEHLHPFSRNGILISFSNNIGNGRDYNVSGYLAVLRQHYPGDIGQLIGTPDDFLPEPDEAYLVRTIHEVNEVGSGMIDRQGRYVDIPHKDELQRLKVMLAEKVLRFRIDNEALGRQIEINWLQFLYRPGLELVEVNFLRPSRSRLGFHLLPPSHYPFPNRLEQLIEQRR